MLKSVPLKVQLVGHTVFTPPYDEAGHWTFLPDPINLTKEDEDGYPIYDGQALVEFAGRVCYQSFHKPNPKTASNAGYLEHILETGHGCYDDQTEVLTEEGWKSWTDVSELDLFATRTESGVLEYHLSEELIVAPYKGEMIRVNSSGVDLLVTPNHKMLACMTTTKEGRKKRDFSLIRADEVHGKSHAYVKTADWDREESTLSRPEAEMLGFSIGDGHMDRSVGSHVRFNLKLDRKKEWLDKLLAELGWEVSRSVRHDGVHRVSVGVPSRLTSTFQGMYEDGQKVIPSGLLMELDYEASVGLLDGLLESDGSRVGTGVCYDTTSKKLVGQVQHLALHAGHASNLGYTTDPGEKVILGETFSSRLGVTRQHIVSRNLRPEVNKFAGAVGKTSIEEYDGVVYCATVPNHTLYVRRNGIPVWSGNSVLEHGSVSFYLTGISRSLTHELIRHRHFSFSELSQRFVNMADAAVVIPPLYREMLDAHIESYGATGVVDEESITEVFYAPVSIVGALSAKSYEEMVQRGIKYLEDSGVIGFVARKQANQAARALMANMTETRMVITGNYRAWLGFLTKRLDPAADAEIRELAQEIHSQLTMHAPNIFSGGGPYEQWKDHGTLT